MKTIFLSSFFCFLNVILIAQSDWSYGMDISAYQGIDDEHVSNSVFKSNGNIEIFTELTMLSLDQTLNSSIEKPNILIGSFVQLRDKKFGMRLSSDFFTYQYTISSVGSDLKNGITTPISNGSTFRASVFQVPGGFIRYWKKWTFYYGSGFTIVHIKDLTLPSVKETFIEEHSAFIASIIPNFKSVYGWFVEFSIGREFPKFNGSAEVGIRLNKDEKSLFKGKKVPANFSGGRDLVYFSLKLPLKEGKIEK